MESALPTTVSRLTDEKVRINNGLDSSLEAALVIVDGTAFPIGKITVGESTYELQNGVPFAEAKLSEEYFTTLYRTLTQDFSFENGIWLVGAREDHSVDVHENARVKVRETSFYVIAGEGHV